jgi:hypothetical protein
MRKPTPTLDNLPASAVVKLMFLRFEIERRNDIAARTKLRVQHPELFDADIIREIYAYYLVNNARAKVSAAQ